MRFCRRSRSGPCRGWRGLRAEVRVEGAHDGKRHGADAVVGVGGLVRPDALAVNDGDAGCRLANARDCGTVADDGVEARCEGEGDAVHAADGLEHGGLPLDHVFNQHAVPEIGVEELVHGERIVDGGRLGAGAGRDSVAGAVGAFEEQIGIEVAVLAEEVDHALAVGGVDFLIERALLDALGEELGDMAASVVDHAALLDGHAAVELVGLHECTARGVDFDFEGDAELVAISEHGAVRGGQARGAGVEVVVRLEGAGLARAIGEFNFVPLRMLQLRPPGRWRASRIVHDQPALPSSYAATSPAMPPPRMTTRVPRPSTRWSGLEAASGSGQEAERLHEDECCAVSTGLAGSHQEVTPGKAHLVGLS